MKEVLKLTLMGQPKPWTSPKTSFFDRAGRKRNKAVSYSEHRDVKEEWRAQIRAQLPQNWKLLEGAVGRQIQYFFELTPTLAKKGFKEGDFLTVKPDDTNLDKLTEDAMTGLVYVDDQQLCRRPGDDFKIIGSPARTEITIYELT